MNPKLRPILYPPGSKTRRDELRRLREIFWFEPEAAIETIQIANKLGRMFPVPGERCEARTRRGTLCQCKALKNGRCKLHGGLSTWAAKSEAGKARSLANLKPFRQK